jgi:hypothetical protein
MPNVSPSVLKQLYVQSSRIIRTMEMRTGEQFILRSYIWFSRNCLGKTKSLRADYVYVKENRACAFISTPFTAKFGDPSIPQNRFRSKTVFLKNTVQRGSSYGLLYAVPHCDTETEPSPKPRITFLTNVPSVLTILATERY